jgi:hypothetical protein
VQTSPDVPRVERRPHRRGHVRYIPILAFQRFPRIIEDID